MHFSRAILALSFVAIAAAVPAPAPIDPVLKEVVAINNNLGGSHIELNANSTERLSANNETNGAGLALTHPATAIALAVSLAASIVL
ncbi:hypothetical protein AX16_000891 [Volvariella volvacea WC 439]|nr:hypothetical protein AX16_000891 [Volvariella volvacea WC 439]